MVKFDLYPVLNAVLRSLAIHCHTEWWRVVSLGMVTRHENLFLIYFKTKKIYLVVVVDQNALISNG